jgi:diadenylate cyclase
MQELRTILDQVRLNAILDIAITSLLIYWLFSLIRGTRAVRLVIGVSVLFVVYNLAIAFEMRLLTQILQAGAVVGLFAIVVIFQPELRRALERIGRVGSLGWLLSPAETRAAELVAQQVARAAAELSAEGHGALIVLERETGLEEVAETGVMLHADVSADLLQTIFTPRSALHDGAVIIREDRIVAAGALLPLAETSIHSERFGTRHRAALGITEQTDAVVIVVSEENGQISLVERARIVRNLTEAGLTRAIVGFLDPTGGRRGAFGWRAAEARAATMGTRRLQSIGRLVGRPQLSRAGAAGATATAGAAGSAGSPGSVQPGTLKPLSSSSGAVTGASGQSAASPLDADDDPGRPPGARASP